MYHGAPQRWKPLEEIKLVSLASKFLYSCLDALTYFNMAQSEKNGTFLSILFLSRTKSSSKSAVTLLDQNATSAPVETMNASTLKSLKGLTTCKSSFQNWNNAYLKWRNASLELRFRCPILPGHRKAGGSSTNLLNHSVDFCTCHLQNL